MKYVVIILGIVIVIALAALLLIPTSHTEPAPVPQSADGTYVDTTFGTIFTYPKGESIKVTPMNDTKEFPGAKIVKSIEIGESGGVIVYEVLAGYDDSITDEPDGHASPIAQTKYFYDIPSRSWMVAYPEGRDDGGDVASSTARAIGTTDGGLPIFLSGRRFDSRIIPISTSQFIVVTSGGGASTEAIAQSVKAIREKVRID